jgi:hypothetical protein
MFKTIKNVKLDHISFDSRTTQLNLSSLKEFRETGESEFTAVRLAFRMKVYSIPTDYSDIFQLAPVNSGIRMELSKPARLGMVVGYDNKDKYKGFILTDSLTLNQWYLVTMKIDIKKRLKVTLNGNTVVNYSTDPGLEYKISDIVVGAGFSKTRKFTGKISDFFIHYQMFEKRQPIICFGLLIIKHIAGLVLLINLFLLLIPTKQVLNS